MMREWEDDAKREPSRAETILMPIGAIILLVAQYLPAIRWILGWR